MDEDILAFGGEIASVKINKTRPDVTKIEIEVPEVFRDQALNVGRLVGCYVEGIALTGIRPPTKDVKVKAKKGADPEVA